MKRKLYKETQQILLGFEQLYPKEEIIPLVRFLIEKLDEPQYSREEFLGDTFKIIKSLDDLPATSQVEQFILASDPKAKIISLMSLIECLTYDELAPHIKLLFKYVDLTSGNIENVEKIIIGILSTLEEKNKAIALVKSLYLEKDKLISLKKLMKLFDYLYDRPIFDRLRKLAEHFETLKSNLEVLNFLFDVTGIQIFERLRYVKQNHPSTEIKDAFSKGQIKSKVWLAKMLSEHLKGDRYEIHILCGWYATLADCLLLNINSSKISSIRSYDINPACLETASTLHQVGMEGVPFVAITQDILDINYRLLNAQSCIINSSCEHIDRFSSWYQLIPDGQLLVLQNNNFFSHKEHINCVSSLDEFKKMAPMTEFLYAGEMALEKYNRYMLIGRK